MEKQLQEVSHDYVRYANCWEDADILMQALKPDSSSRVLSIGSAGDNSFSFLAFSPELVVAVDINPVQLKLIQLKKTAISILKRKEYLEFIGFHETEMRAFLFARVKNALEKEGHKEVSDYWEAHENQVLDGIIHAGKFEKYFHVFSKKVLPLIHNEKRISKLFNEKTQPQQEQFYNHTWNSKRWQGLFKVFFGKFVMGRLGRSKAFLNEVEVPVGEFIFNKAEKHLQSINCQKNYFLKYILTGNFDEHLPHYVREGIYEKIQENINKLEIFEGLADTAFEKYGKFNRFNLSDIFEYMTPEIFDKVAQNFLENSMQDSLYGYWNLMVPRRVSEIKLDNFEYLKEFSEELTEKDMGFFYGKFIVERFTEFVSQKS